MNDAGKKDPDNLSPKETAAAIGFSGTVIFQFFSINGCLPVAINDAEKGSESEFKLTLPTVV